jgi:hypothetical protein
MKKTFISILFVTIVTVATNAKSIKKLDLEDLSSITPQITTDSKVKSAGKSSLKIRSKWPATICLGEIKCENIENCKLVYSAKIKTEIKGLVFLEMWVTVNGKQYFSKGLRDAVKGKTDWTTTKAMFFLKKGQKVQKAVLNLVIQGGGTVWIDEVELSTGPLK